MRKSKGFTLLELMTTLAVATILLMIGVPAMVDFVANNRIYTTASDFTHYLAYTKNEAINRGFNVGICAASDNTLTACDDDGSYDSTQSWSNGWIVFQDQDGDGTFDDSDEILMTRPPLANNQLLTGSSARVIYTSSGTPSLGVTTYRATRVNCSGEYSVDITVSPTGIGRLAEVTC